MVTILFSVFLCKIDGCDGLVKSCSPALGCDKCGTIYNMFDHSIMYKRSEDGKLLQNETQDLGKI